MSGFVEKPTNGQKFWFLTAICRLGSLTPIYYICRCDCGNLVTVLKWKLKSGRTKSCGCMSHILQSEAITTHGMSHSSEYASYASAKNRCQNPKDARYNDYGGRGIEFRFKSFEEFYNHIGPRPYKLTLDRINNNGHYELGNVRWATAKQQIENQRKRIVYDESKAFADAMGSI